MTRPPCRTARLCLLCVLLTGCASETPYPSAWQPRPSDGAWCGALSGAFENLPVESVETHEGALYRGRENGVYLTLAGILFGEPLVVVDVTHVTFEPTPEGALRVVPWFGERKLDEEGRVIEPRHGDCDEDRWLVKSGWDFDGYMIASAAVWTAGAVLPAATQVYYELTVDAEDRLVVHALLRTAGALFYVFPFRTLEGDAWYAYRRHTGTTAPVVAPPK